MLSVAKHLARFVKQFGVSGSKRSISFLIIIQTMRVRCFTTLGMT